MGSAATDHAGSPAPGSTGSTGRERSIAAVAVGALGVVYGDIGTSPLYALEQCVAFVRGAEAVPAEDILGILSLIFWALMLVVTVKYLGVIMRADNQGEGGILALLALAGSPAARSPDPPPTAPGPAGSEATGGESATRTAARAAAAAIRAARGTAALATLGIFGAALLYGDGAITPAISVLSAVEGLGVATNEFQPWVVPITVVLLFGLFSVQRWGTERVSRYFGPTMLVWFVTIGVLGAARIVQQAPEMPSVFRALDPTYGALFLVRHGMPGILILGCVVLAITGAEALYADLGHFGARPIRLAWVTIVFPALVLNYFGQGALLLEEGRRVVHPFFDLAPAWGLYPLVGLATVATIIASQSLISGVFSLTQQAVQLGYSPRLQLVHTSSSARGQIYMPQVNFALMLVCLLLVVGFRHSAALASAYGIAVTGTMSVTSILFYVVARRRWAWSRVRAGLVVGGFLAIDLAFLLANADKIESGGWLPLAIASVVFVLMSTWKAGRELLAQMQARSGCLVDEFFEALDHEAATRVPGTAVYFSTNTSTIPAVLLHNLEVNRVVHERVLLVTVAASAVPTVKAEESVTVLELGHGFFRVAALFGFMDVPSMDSILDRCVARGLVVDRSTAVYFISRDSLLTSGPLPMPRWRKRLFALLWRNNPSLVGAYHLPPGRALEIGVQVEL